jgi:hypothetical protein
MTKDEKQSILELSFNKKSLIEFEQEFPDRLTKEYILEVVESSYFNNDPDDLEYSLLLGFIIDIFDHDFAHVLSKLIVESWHFKHEDIAMILKQIKSPQSVDSLYNATEMQFEYLGYDNTYQFARKCIKALSAIGDENATNRLRLLAVSKTTEIAGYAQKELRYMGML